MSTIPQSNNGKHPPPSSFPPSSFNNIRNSFLPPLSSVSQHSNTLTPLNYPQPSQHQQRPQFAHQPPTHPQAPQQPNHHFQHQSQQNVTYLHAEHQQYLTNNHNPTQQQAHHLPQSRPTQYHMYQRPYVPPNHLVQSNLTNPQQRVHQLPQPTFSKFKAETPQNEQKNTNPHSSQANNHPNQGQIFIHQSTQQQQILHQAQSNPAQFANQIRPFNFHNLPQSNSNHLRQYRNVEALNQQQRLQQSQAQAQPAQTQQNQYQNQPPNQLQAHMPQTQQTQQTPTPQPPQNSQESAKKRRLNNAQPWANQAVPQNSQNTSSALHSNNTQTNIRPANPAGQPRSSLMHPMNAVLSSHGLPGQFQPNIHMTAYDYESFGYHVLPQGDHIPSQQYHPIPYSAGPSPHTANNMPDRAFKLNNGQNQSLKPTSSPQFLKMTDREPMPGMHQMNQPPTFNNLKRELSPHSIAFTKPPPTNIPIKSSDSPKIQNQPGFLSTHSTIPTPAASVPMNAHTEIKIAPLPVPESTQPTDISPSLPANVLPESPNSQTETKKPKSNLDKPKTVTRPPTTAPNCPGRVPSHLLVTKEQREQILAIHTPKMVFDGNDKEKAVAFLSHHKLTKEQLGNTLCKWKTRNTRRRKSIVTHLYQCCCGSDVRNFHGTKGVRKSKQKYPFVSCLAFVEVARRVDDDTLLWVRGILDHDEKCKLAIPYS